MMQIRCQHCGWMFTLSREAIGLALAEAQATNEQYHTINCPQCRHAIKLQILEMRQRLPADYPLPEWTPVAPEPPQPKAAPTPAELATEKEPEEKPAVRKAAPRAKSAKPKAKARTVRGKAKTKVKAKKPKAGNARSKAKK